MNTQNEFKAVLTEAGRESNVTMSLIGKTNMFLCKYDSGSMKLISSRDLLSLLGEQKLDFADVEDREKFVEAMDVAIPSSVWLTKTRDKVTLAGGILIGSAIAITAMTKIISVLARTPRH